MKRSIKNGIILTGLMLILALALGPVKKAGAQDKAVIKVKPGAAAENQTDQTGGGATRGAGDIEIWETKGDVTKIDGKTIYINESPFLANDRTSFYSAENESIYFSDLKEIDVVLVKYYYQNRSAEGQVPILVEVRVSPPL